MNLEDVLAAYKALPKTKQKKIEKDALKVTAHMPFVPNPGSQTDAYLCEADELFYGGAAGGGKSSLICGLAVNEYHPALLLRRESAQAGTLVSEIKRILGPKNDAKFAATSVNGGGIWTLPKGGTIEIAGVAHEDDKEKYQGRAHRLKAFDEITQFTESQYRYLINWLRDVSGKRCRIVCTGNPPTTTQGQWVIRYWAPWLDKHHPNPAKSGELRWFTTVNGQDHEVDGRGPHMIDGREVLAQSRCFIAGRLEDNPDLMETNYASRLEAAPKELRDRLRYGRFDVEPEDDAWQIIPSKWIAAAQARWTETPSTEDMTALGVDVAQGGQDRTVLIARHGDWYGRPDVHEGADTPDGPSVAALVASRLRDRARVVVDAGGGYGGDTLTALAQADMPCYGHKGASGSRAVSREGVFAFYNFRSECLWLLREDLDPDYQSRIALPPDVELAADLASYRYEVRERGGKQIIHALPKELMRAELGRSPDKGDALVMAYAAFAKSLAEPRIASDRRKARANLQQHVLNDSRTISALRKKLR